MGDESKVYSYLYFRGWLKQVDDSVDYKEGYVVMVYK